MLKANRKTLFKRFLLACRSWILDQVGDDNFNMELTNLRVQEKSRNSGISIKHNILLYNQIGIMFHVEHSGSKLYFPIQYSLNILLRISVDLFLPVNSPIESRDSRSSSATISPG